VKFDFLSDGAALAPLVLSPCVKISKKPGWAVSRAAAFFVASLNILRNGCDYICSVETDMNRDGSHPKHENCVK
jgi:hypothetical protein